MRHSIRLLAIQSLATLMFTWGVHVGGPPEARGQIDVPTYPPSGFPRRTVRQVPGAQAGPASGLVAPSASTVPGGTAFRPGAAQPAITANQTPVPQDTGRQYSWRPRTRLSAQAPYYSPRNAAGNLQGRLRLIDPLMISGGTLAPGVAPGNPVVSGLPQGYGLTPSTIGLDALAQYGETLDPREEAQTAVPSLPSDMDSVREMENQFQIPFERFETYEEFRTWLDQQLATPGGGAVGRAMADDGLSEDQQPAERGNGARRRAPQVEQPPIGYVGPGSAARTRIANFNLGQDIAQDSAQLVQELNQYLQQSRELRQARNRPSAAGGPGLPLPRSSLGSQLGIESLPLPYETIPAGRGFEPQDLSGQYLQSPDRFDLPGNPNAWLPPSAGY